MANNNIHQEQSALDKLEKEYEHVYWQLLDLRKKIKKLQVQNKQLRLIIQRQED